MDQDIFTAVAVVAGVVLVAVNMRKDNVPPPPVADPEGEVMDVDVVQLQPTKDKGKEFQLAAEGDVRAEANRIYNYVCGEIERMIQLQHYFESGFMAAGNKNISWLKQTLPDEYRNLIVALNYCRIKETEFKELNAKLISMKVNDLAAAMANLFATPTQVIARLNQFAFVSEDDIRKYSMEEIRGMLGGFQRAGGEAIQALQNQIDNYAELTAEAMERLDNKLDNAIMQDDAGHLLMKDPNSAGMVYLKTTRQVTLYDQYGNPYTKEQTEYANMPQNQFQPNDGPGSMGWQGTGYMQPGVNEGLEGYQKTNNYPMDPYRTIPQEVIDIDMNEAGEAFQVSKVPNGGVQLAAMDQYKNEWNSGDEKEEDDRFSVHKSGKKPVVTTKSKPQKTKVEQSFNSASVHVLDQGVDVVDKPNLYHTAPPNYFIETREQAKMDSEELVKIETVVDPQVNDPPNDGVVETQFDQTTIPTDEQGNTNIFGDIRNPNPYAGVQQQKALIPKRGPKRGSIRGRSQSFLDPELYEGDEKTDLEGPAVLRQRGNDPNEPEVIGARTFYVEAAPEQLRIEASPGQLMIVD